MLLGGAMHADEELRHPWLADERVLIQRLLDAGRRCSASVSGHSSSPERPARRWRRRRAPRSAGSRSSSPRTPRTTRCSATPVALPGLPVALLRLRRACRRRGAGPQRGLSAGVPARRVRLGRPVPSGGDGRDRGELDRGVTGGGARHSGGAPRRDRSAHRRLGRLGGTLCAAASSRSPSGSAQAPSAPSAARRGATTRATSRSSLRVVSGRAERDHREPRARSRVAVRHHGRGVADEGLHVLRRLRHSRRGEQRRDLDVLRPRNVALPRVAG